MTQRFPVILRGLPSTDTVPAAGRPYRGPALGSQVATFVHFAGTSPTDAFGAILVARGTLVLEAVLVVPDATDAATVGRLRRWGERHPIDTLVGTMPWRVVTLSAYFAPDATRERQPWAFVPNAYSGTGPVVGCDLGRSFGLVAEHVVERSGRNRETWALWLPGWGGWRCDKGDVVRTSPHRPQLYLFSRRVGWSLSFAPCERGKGKWTTAGPWRGEFVDVASAAYALDADRAAGFVEHSRNFGLVADELPVVASFDAHGAVVMAGAVGQVHALALRLDDETGRYFTSLTDRREGVRRLPLARLHSPAAIADHLLRQVGAAQPLRRLDLTEQELARWWESYHGGRCDDLAALRGRAFKAVVLDLTSAYSLVAHWTRWWDSMTADRLERRSVLRQLRVLCLRAVKDPSAVLDPAVGERFGFTVCEVVPDADILPVSLDDPTRPDGRTETVPVTARGRTMFYAWADVVASAVMTGKVPRIVRATRLVPVGRQAGLRSRLAFLDGMVLDTTKDPVVALVARRRRAKAEKDDTLSALLHAGVNALVSGQPARLDDGYRTVGGTWEKVERNSAWTFVPLASSTTAGARLLLAVLDRMVRDRGGVVAYRDTDSSIVPASPEGGTLTLADGSLVRELSYTDVDDLRRAFEPLSPEPGAWPVWKVTPGPGEAPVRSLVFGPKRHVEYVGTDDAPALVEWTETTLGGKWSDPAAMTGRCAEGGRAWSKAAVEREVRYAGARLVSPAKALRGRAAWDLPGTERFPTLRRLAVTSPVLASTLPDTLGPIRPGTRYVEAMPGDAGTRVETVHAVAVDPGGALTDWLGLGWVDRHTGAPVAVTTDPMDYGAVLVESLAARAGRYGDAPRGEAVSSVLVAPLSVIHRGRVSPVIDADDDGMPGSLIDERLRYEDAHGLGPGQRRALVALAAAMPVRRFAELAKVTPRVARDLARGKLPGPSTVRRILVELRHSGGAWLVPDKRRCALEGCDHPVEGRRVYCACCPAHAEVGRKRRQRAARAGAVLA